MKIRMFCVAAALAAAPAFSATCEGLTGLKLKNTAITSAQVVAKGEFNAPGGKGKQPATFRDLATFCRVAATLTPSSDSDIKIEVWLPAESWNGSLQSVGNGAWAGTISYPAMGTALAAGFATASTDTGHAGNNAEFILGHPEKLNDFAYRAVHEMTVAAKAIVAGYYGKPAKYSFWNGCSTGGRQALAEAQRYPGDYDGIIAGAAANYPTHLQGAQVWNATVAHKTEAAYVPPPKYALVKNAVLAACDAIDGVKDGVLEDPRRCKYDPGELVCKGADAPSCLTAAQVETVRKTYQGMTTRGGQQLFPGLERGSEAGWNTLMAPQPMSLALETYKYIVHKDAKWDYLSFDPDTDVPLADKTVASLMNSTDPNLKKFFDHGGKLLMYHGWSDPGIAPQNSVNYYQSVVDRLGGTAKTSNSIRLFMVPAMGHCRGGDGTDSFDLVSMLNAWVANGKAPERIEASRIRDGKTDRTRPLCPYPQTAQYQGSGSTDESQNFACRMP